MEDNGTPFGNKLQLYCERGFLLRISDSGVISGTDDNSDPYSGTKANSVIQIQLIISAHLELSSGDEIGTVKIRGIHSGLYVCFGENGKPSAKENPGLPGTTFREDFYGHSYNSYESKDYPGWMLGINKAGQAKNGTKTEAGKKSTKFLPIRL
ncbi:unnamed protein product [Ceutorhynchus assimilis]|uniref:Fibroblast growth factor n=1 Tax=Ceutorhynchus assimilis TaxID=467358 RepID=A0A9N9MIG4_9CUCU|nr:unnamed protein product [Ceutorhynchus assimilis]